MAAWDKPTPSGDVPLNRECVQRKQDLCLPALSKLASADKVADVGLLVPRWVADLPEPY